MRESTGYAPDEQLIPNYKSIHYSFSVSVCRKNNNKYLKFGWVIIIIMSYNSSTISKIQKYKMNNF